MKQSSSFEQVRQYYVLWREMNNMYEAWSRSNGLSYNAMLILYSLWEDENGCTQKTICQQWTLPKQTVNTILKDYEKKNLIEFSVASNDHRNKLVRLTEAGKAFTKDIIPKLQKLETEVMERLGSERAEAIIENTALFIDYFKEGMSNE